MFSGRRRFGLFLVLLLAAAMTYLGGPSLRGADAQQVQTLAVGRTFAYHQITSLDRDYAFDIPVLSANGAKVVFADGPGTGDAARPNRIYVINTDGTGLTEVDSYTTGCYCGSFVDISADGSKVVSSEGLQLRIANADGTSRRSLITGVEITSIRIAGDGTKVFFKIRRDSFPNNVKVERGLYVINPDGTGLRQVVGPSAIATLTGKAADAVFPFGTNGSSLDVSTDGSRVVFGAVVGGVGEVIFGVGGDGTGLRQLVTGQFVNRTAISGDGTKVGYNIMPPPCCSTPNEVGVLGFDGTGKKVLGTNVGSDSGQTLQLSADGSKLLLGDHGYLYDTATGAVTQLGAYTAGSTSGGHTTVLYDGLYRPTMNSTASRFLYLMSYIRCADCANQPKQLAVMEINPTSLGEAPAISEASVSPDYVLLRGGSTATVKARVTSSNTILGVGAPFFRDGLFDINLRSNSFNGPVLRDDGKDGDVTVGDKVYTSNQLSHSAVVVRTPDTGLRTGRIEAEVRASNGRLHATSIEFGTVNVVDTAPATATATPSQAATSTPTGPTATPTATATPGQAPVVTGIRPVGASNTAATPVEVSGANFRSGAAVTLEGLGTAQALTGVTVVNATTIRASVPAGISPGRWDVVVTNADGTSGRLLRSFAVLADAPSPRAIRPGGGINTLPTEVMIEGLNFREGITLELELAGVTQTISNVLRIDSGHLQAVIPAGLSVGVYDVVLRNPGVSSAGRLASAFTAFSLTGDDFIAGEDDIWTNPVTVRAGVTVELGLNFHRLGGKTTVQVPVSFYLGAPGAGGTLIGSTTSVPVPPRTDTDSVFVNWAVGSEPGAVTVYAVLNPDGTLTESSRANNTASRSITILPAATTDTTPPTISSLTLDNGARQTTDTEIAVAVVAADPSPGTGVARMYLAERLFNAAARSWVPVQNTGWITYTTPYNLTLTDSPGVRYVQAWVADGAGNVSLQAVKQRIDYVASSDKLEANGVRLYRRTLAAGQSLTVKVTPSSGDADLYIWDPNGNSVLVKNAEGTAVDEGTITASVAGVYQIEIYAYTATTFQVSITGGSGLTVGSERTSAVTPSETKTARTEPSVSASSEPEGNIALPVAPLTGSSNQAAYLPVVFNTLAGGW